MESQDEKITYKVYYDNLSEQQKVNKTRRVVWDREAFSCSCGLYVRSGFICRHMFLILKVRVIKDVSNIVHKRWKKEPESIEQEFHNFTEDSKACIADEERKKRIIEKEEEDKSLDVARFLRETKTQASQQKKTIVRISKKEAVNVEKVQNFKSKKDLKRKESEGDHIIKEKNKIVKKSL